MLLPLLRLESRCLPRRGRSGKSSSSSYACRTAGFNLCLSLFRVGSVRCGRLQRPGTFSPCRSTFSRASETKDGINAHGSGLLSAHSNGLSRGMEGERAKLSKDRGNVFYFDAGYALFAKRPSRPFPPPFASGASQSGLGARRRHDGRSGPRNRMENGRSEDKNSEDGARSKREAGGGERKVELTQDLRREIEVIRGVTNGDDAVLVSERFIGANDGVGAWATKENGHAALWSRLIIHFWALEAEKDGYGNGRTPDPVAYLQRAFDKVKKATSNPYEWLGTTTACSALLSTSRDGAAKPVVFATQLGDSGILIFRPEDKSTLFKTIGQWHWFDCPRQLGTNSPDVPQKNAITNRVEIQEGDVVLAVTDGVLDNLWDHEVAESVFGSLKSWEKNEKGDASSQDDADGREKMRYVAQELVKAAQDVAEDPFAESPYMEKAIEEGISIEGGKLDDISVVAAECRRHKSSEIPKT